MRVINCRRYKARKRYKYYDGEINVGHIYFRGFAVNDNDEPFEFMFTDNKFYNERKIPKTLLNQEFNMHAERRKLRNK